MIPGHAASPAASDRARAARLARAAGAVAALRRREGRAAAPGQDAKASLTLADIIAGTSAYFAQPVSEVLSPRRDAALCRCRRVIACLSREQTAMTFTQIARRLRRSHPSVIASFATIQRLRAAGSPELEADLAAIRAALGATKIETLTPSTISHER